MQLTELVHETLKTHLQSGAFAIDATAGNGHDAYLLAKSVGKCGKVIAIDIQEMAIKSTRTLLSEKGLADRVTLLAGDHSVILEKLSKEYKDSIDSIVFNLGYLPGSDKRVKTSAKNTIRALDASTNLLRPSGLLCVTAYRAHHGGEEETKSVGEWMTSKTYGGWNIKCHEPNSNNMPPILWIAGSP